MNTKSFKQPRRQSLIREIWDFTGPGFRSARKRFEAQSWSTDKHIVLTGATSGLGLSAAKTLAAAGATLTLVVRDEKKGGALKLECETLGAAGCQVIVADMALLVDARHVIDVLLEQNIPIDVLINNAGALFNTRAETAEGLEQSTSLLLLSPIMLMQGLKPLLQASKSARVVNVVSGGMYTQRLSMSWLRSGFAHRYDGPAVYAQAKRALAIVTEEWHQEWAKHGVYLNTMHPGWADTPGVQTALPTFRRWTQWILRSPDEGADTIVWMAVSSELDRVSGCLFLDRQARRYYLNKKTQERPTDRRALLSYINEYVSF
jgi:NAD(P)-dependent dehydrogenase (short-subunit alcohol dehydrogenase family)